VHATAMPKRAVLFAIEGMADWTIISVFSRPKLQGHD